MNPRHSRSNSVLRKHSGGGVCLRNAKKLSRAAGMTLLELLVACSILVILSTVAVPMVRRDRGASQGERPSLRFAQRFGMRSIGTRTMRTRT